MIAFDIVDLVENMVLNVLTGSVMLLAFLSAEEYMTSFYIVKKKTKSTLTFGPLFLLCECGNSLIRVSSWVLNNHNSFPSDFPNRQLVPVTGCCLSL